MKNQKLVHTPRNTSRLARLLEITVLFSILAPGLHSADIEWDADGLITDQFLFTDAANWDAAAAPAGGDVAQFLNNATGIVLFDQDVTISNLFIDNSAGDLIFDLGGNTLTLTESFPPSWVGRSESPNNFEMHNGTFVHTRLRTDASNGTIVISGSNTVLNGSERFRIWGGDDNTVSLQGGAQMSYGDASTPSQIGGDAGSGNIFTITGGGSSFSEAGELAIGSTGGNGNSVNVLNGGSLTVAALRVGDVGANNTTVQIGNGAEVKQIGGAGTEISIGNSGSNNQVIVDSGGSLEGYWIRMGLNTASSNSLLDINGGTADITRNIWMGRSGTDSTLLVRNNGVLDVGEDVNIGIDPGETGHKFEITSGGTANVERVWNRRGEVLIQDGTLKTDTLLMDVENAPTATFKFESGLLAVGTATVDNGVAFEVGDSAIGATATYRMTDDSATHDFAAGLRLRENARLEGGGSIIGDVTAVGTGATVSPGVGAGFDVIDVNGLFDNDGTTLEMKLGDFSGNFAFSGSNFDQLISSTVVAGGEVSIDLSQYVQPTSQTSFVLIEWDNLNGNTGDFNVTFSQTDPSLSYQFVADGLQITAVPEPRNYATVMGLGVLCAICVRRRRRSR